MEYHTLFKKDDFHLETQNFFKGQKVCVPGGSGFIGSHLVEQLVHLGAHPVVPSRQKKPKFLQNVAEKIELRQCDLEDPSQAGRAVEGCDTVLNLAAKVAGIEFNKNHPASIFQDNLQVFFNLIHASQKQNVSRFLVTSSACVYPRHCSIPTPEAEGMQDEPESTNSGYGWSKRMEEYLGQKYAEEFGMSVAIARPYNSYGPRDNFDPKSSHVLPALIKKALETSDNYFEVWGDGSHSRSFLYVDDFARGLLETAARYPEADPINIGAHEEVTIKQSALWIAEIVGELREKSLEPRFNPQGITGQPRRMCDTTKAKEKIGFEARVSFRDGLKRTIEWYLDEN